MMVTIHEPLIEMSGMEHRATLLGRHPEAQVVGALDGVLQRGRSEVRGAEKMIDRLTLILRLNELGLLSPAEADGFTVVQEAFKAALMDRANRGARQVEEHYLREASKPRANNVRGRLDDAIGCTDLDAIVTHVLSVDPKRPLSAPLKQKGLEDGVSLR